MKTVSANKLHEKLSIEDSEIILNGTPDALSGYITLNNTDKEALFIRELPVSTSGKGKRHLFIRNMIPMQIALGAGEKRIHNISQQMPSDTPPGEYDQFIEVGGKKKKLKVIVQPNIEVDFIPMNLQFAGVVPGKTYTAQITCMNRGNMPFKIPNIRHVSMLDEDYLCRAMSNAMRSKGGEGFTPMMDEMVKDIYKDMVDWVTVKLDESGQTVKPGKSIQLHFHLTLPKEKIDRNKDYYGNVRIWNQVISYNIKA